MRRVTDEFGTLCSVVGSCEAEEAAEARFEEVTLRFSNGVLSVSAVSSDDTIKIQDAEPQDNSRTDLSGADQWRDLLGATVIWTWMLENQQGYVDGFQMELAEAEHSGICSSWWRPRTFLFVGSVEQNLDVPEAV